MIIDEIAQEIELEETAEEVQPTKTYRSKNITEEVIYDEILPMVLEEFSYTEDPLQVVRWNKNVWEKSNVLELQRAISERVTAFCWGINNGRNLSWSEQRNLKKVMSSFCGDNRSLGQFFYGAIPLQKKRHYLSFKGSDFVFNTETYQKEPLTKAFTKKVSCFNRLNFVYDESAVCPKFEKFVDQIMCNDQELKKVLLDYLAYSVLISHCDYEKFAVFHGVTARNGKSTLIEVVQNLVGEGNFVTKQPANLGEKFGLSGCDTAQMITCPEVSDKKIDTSIIKSIASGESVMYEKKNQDATNIKITAKMIFACNEAPKFVLDAGLTNRVLVFPFNLHLEEKDRDPNLINDLLAELSGIFNLLVRHAKNLTKDSFNNLPHSMLKAKDEMLYAGCPISEYCKFNISIGDGLDDPIPRNKIYLDFSNHCRDEGIRENNIPGPERFWNSFFANCKHLSKEVGQVQHQYFSDRETARNDRVRINGKQMRVVKYVQLNK